MWCGFELTLQAARTTPETRTVPLAHIIWNPNPFNQSGFMRVTRNSPHSPFAHVARAIRSLYRHIERSASRPRSAFRLRTAVKHVATR